MDLLSARQKLVASNIANADTPGYHTQDIDFQFEFQNAATGTPGSSTLRDSPSRTTAIMSVWTARRGCWRKTRCGSKWLRNLMRSQIRVVRSAIEEGKNG